MQLSNRLTFSLASLVILIAFGLVFAPMSVMAHPVTATNSGAGQPHATDTPVGATHSHPEIMVTIKDADDRTDGIQVVDTGADEAATALDFTGAVTPTLQFDVTLTVPEGAQDGGSAVGAGTFSSTDVPIIAYNSKFAAVGASIAFDTFAQDDPTGAPRAWTATATLTLDQVPSGADADATQEAYYKAIADAIEAGIMVDITVNAELIQMTGLVAGPMAGHSNLQSKTTVSMIAAPDRTAPMLTDPTPTMADGVVTVPLAFNEALDGMPAVTDMTAADSAIAGTYEVGDVEGSGMSFTVKLTLDSATAESGDIPAGTVTLGISAMDPAGNALAADTTVDVMLAARPFVDDKGPEVVVVPLLGAHDEAFDITFTATDNYSMGDDLTVAVAITPAAAVTDAAPMAEMQADGSYMVTVTPVAPTAATPSIAASTITVTVTATDEAENSASDSEFFFLAARTYSDDVNPTLTATPGAPDPTTGAIMVTLAFSEAIQGMPTVTHAAMPAALADTYMVSAVTAAPAPAMNTYMVTVTPNELAIGDANLPAGTVTLTVSAMDAAGNALAAPGNTAAVQLAARTAPEDKTAPTFTHNAPTTGISAAIMVTLTFSEAVTGVGVTGTPSMDDAQYTTVVAGSGTSHTVTITPTPRAALAEDMGQRIIMFVVSGVDAADNKVDGSFSLILAPRKTTPVRPGNKKPVFTDKIEPIIGTVGMAITPVTLPAATDPDGDELVHSIAEPLPAGLTFNEIARYLSGTPTASQAATTYTYVANDGNGGLTPLNFTIEVKAKATVTDPVRTATIPSKGYAVLVNTGATAAHHGIGDSVTTVEVDLPNLYEFFRDGGTIVLNGPAGTAARAVKITEIMWGQDAHLNDPTMSQWIEIENTTSAAITVDFGSSGSWSLTFKQGEYDPNPAGAVDHLGNLGNPGFWQVVDTTDGTYGQSGRSESTDTEDQEELVSMIRKNDNTHRSDGWEKANRPSVNISGARVANPGSAKRIVAEAAAKIDRSTVFISEIGNLADGSDWIELYNSSDSAQNIKNWIISTVTAADVASATDAQLTAGNTEGGGIDKEVVQFGRATYEDALKIPAKSYLLVTAKDPAANDSPLAVGINLQNTKVNRDPKDNETTGQTHLYYVASGLKIPNEASLVILRNHHEKEGRSANFRDVVNIGEYVASPDVNVFIVGTNTDNSWNTEVWPLEATRKPGDRENLGAGNNSIIERNIGKTNHWAHKDLWAPAPFTGLGYDRDISESATTKGTPGYANGGGLEKIADLKDGDITISEIMYATGNGRLPQWIELYNSSMTRSVNLNGWDLEINNVDSADIMSNEYINRRIVLGNVKVLPNQTVLIVSTSGRNTGRDVFPSQRTIDLSSPDAFGRENRLDPILSSVGFNVALYDKDNKPVDEVGNIDNNRRTSDDPAWELPDADTDDGRTSIVRRYDQERDGIKEDAWILASETNLAYLNVGNLYYGRSTDVGTPGFRGGGPLPVSLSKFRPERLDDGTIAVRWVTESELDNAGFNILRSETKDGEFTKLNEQLIAGKGTTSEKNSYEFVDTSAKPNVVYYYQIQDVSLDGDVTTLKTTHLRGNISVVGKLTTTWGELKALQ